MNRRSFFKGLAAAAALAAGRFYPVPAAPALLSRELTLAEWAKQASPYGVSPVAEILAARNSLLDDLVFVPAPADRPHRVSVVEDMREEIRRVNVSPEALRAMFPKPRKRFSLI